MKCGTCHWWEKIEADTDLAQNNGIVRGRCHRMPPSATPVLVPQINKFTQQMEPVVMEMAIWPVTIDGAYCGEHKVVLEKALA